MSEHLRSSHRMESTWEVNPLSLLMERMLEESLVLPQLARM